VLLSQLSTDELLVARDGEFWMLGGVTEQGDQLLVYLEHEKWLPRLTTNDSVSAVICTPAMASRMPQRLGVAMADDPKMAFCLVHNELAKTDFYGQLDGPSVISSSAQVHWTASVADHDVIVGPRSVIGPNAVILPQVEIGADVEVMANSTVGTGDFQFVHRDGSLLTVAHTGWVRLGQGVTVFSNVVIDRGLMSDTVIGEESKIAGLCYVAHGAKLGRRVRLTPCVIVGGSVEIGDDAWVGPNASIGAGVRIGARARVTIGAVVTKDVPDDGRVTGNFAIEHDRFLTHLRAIR
jgi:UDP-3-O-[3-hydroxymyristoyl] glucosamine N-acyltransferase